MAGGGRVNDIINFMLGKDTIIGVVIMRASSGPGKGRRLQQRVCGLWLLFFFFSSRYVCHCEDTSLIRGQRLVIFIVDSSPPLLASQRSGWNRDYDCGIAS